MYRNGIKIMSTRKDDTTHGQKFRTKVGGASRGQRAVAYQLSFKLLCFREFDWFLSEEPSIQCIVMAATGVREEGFYSTLNVVSSLNILPSPLKRGKKGNSFLRGGKNGNIKREKKKGEHSMNCVFLILLLQKEYLVKYKGYSAYETSWDPAENFTAECIRSLSFICTMTK